jgi:hypothetical protein
MGRQVADDDGAEHGVAVHRFAAREDGKLKIP